MSIFKNLTILGVAVLGVFAIKTFIVPIDTQATGSNESGPAHKPMEIMLKTPHQLPVVTADLG